MNRNFLFHGTELYRRGTLQGVTDFAYANVLCLRGLCHNFSSIFFVSQYRRTLQGHPFVMCLGIFPVAKKFTDEKGGVSVVSVENFLSQSAGKLRMGNLSVSLI